MTRIGTWLREHAYVITPVALTFVLGVWGIGTPGLWYDERVTAETTIYGPFVFPWEATHIPYYILTWIWTGGGQLTSDAWLRASSVVATVVAVSATSIAAKTLAGRRAGLAAGIMLILLPGVQRYSQEARLYALTLALVALATLALVSGLQRSRAGWRWYALSLLAIGFVTPFALTVIFAHAVLVLGPPSNRRSVKKWSVCVALLIVPLATQLAIALRMDHFHSWVPEPTFIGLLSSPLWVGALPAPGDVTSMFSVAVLAAWILALLTSRGRWWAAGTAVGVISLWLVSLTFMNFWLVRSTLGLSVILVIGASIALARWRSWQLVILFVAIFLLNFSQYQGFREPGGRAEDVKAAVAIIEAEGRTGDTINTKSRQWLEFGVRRYSADPGRYRFDDSSEGRAWVFSGDARAIECPVIREWEIPGDGRVTLCGSLPVGWSAKFQ